MMINLYVFIESTSIYSGFKHIIIAQLPGMGLEHETSLSESGHTLQYVSW